MLENMGVGDDESSAVKNSDVVSGIKVSTKLETKSLLLVPKVNETLGDTTNIELIEEKSEEDSCRDVTVVSVGRNVTLGERDTVNGVAESVSTELIKKKMDEDCC